MRRASQWSSDWTRAKGSEASRLRQRKRQLIQQFDIPEGLLPGTLCVTQRKCGKPTCHCAAGGGHESWSWTFMLKGRKHVEHVPSSKIDEIQRRVEAGREFQDAVREVLAANARLIVLEREQRRAKKKR